MALGRVFQQSDLATAEEPGFRPPYLVLQHRGQDVLAVPAVPKAASLAGVDKYQAFTAKRRLYRAVSSALIRIGAARFAAVQRANPLGSEFGLDFARWCAELERRLGRRVAHAIVTWPPQRARRRSYVHLLDEDLQSFAFVKLAITTEDEPKLAAEANALDYLAQLPLCKIQAPRALHHGRFEGVSFLVIEPLPPASKPLTLNAEFDSSKLTAEYQGVLKVLGAPEIMNLSWWAAYANSLRAEHHSFHAELLRLLPLTSQFGRAHGDLGLANMVGDNKHIWIFDWETCHAAAPALADSIGFFMSFNISKTLRDPVYSLRRFWSRFAGDGSDERVLAIMLALAFRHACGVPDADSFMQDWNKKDASA